MNATDSMIEVVTPFCTAQSSLSLVQALKCRLRCTYLNKVGVLQLVSCILMLNSVECMTLLG